ncbi:MAG: 4-hydroxybenzoate octaprenyltransferase [Porticoccaceae bacterium]|nr:4-hydroxybenzoate octaprenyltransferase [Porticoccaceae bacterium]
MTESRLEHFIHLTRLHKPVGTILLLWPALWALWLAAGGMPDGDILVIFIVGGFVMRAAGCVINDYADRHLDAHVERTSYRPIAIGKIKPWEALLLFVLLSLIGFGLVLLTNRLTVLLACIGVLIIAIYPFMKRYTHLPQAVLGLAWAWSIPMAFAAQTQSLPAGLWLLVTAVVCWTMVFDTFYAMVDRDDDLKIGIKSSAILFGARDLHIIAAFQVLTVIAFVLTGISFSLGISYFLGVAVIAGLFVHQLVAARQRDRDGCFKAFMDNRRVGFTLFVAIVVDYLI